MKTYQELKDESEALYLQAQEKQEEAEAAQRAQVAQGGIEAWRGYNFESSSGTTEEWAAFSKEMQKHLKKTLAPELSLVSYSRGHFYFSAFLKNNETGNLAYISCSDVRGRSDEWYEGLLVRTAKHDKDYTGGSNNFSTLAELKEKTLTLTA